MILRATPEFDARLLGSSSWDKAHIADRFDLFRDTEGNAALMLPGGSKNGQERDIARARKIMGWENA
jgi:hypothetical protein